MYDINCRTSFLLAKEVNQRVLLYITLFYRRLKKDYSKRSLSTVEIHIYFMLGRRKQLQKVKL